MAGFDEAEMDDLVEISKQAQADAEAMAVAAAEGGGAYGA
jgi:hypothetical protein